MKIGIFTNNYLPNPYGVTQSIESFRRQFEKQGHSVFIFAPFAKGYADENPSACPTENFSNKNFGRIFRYPSIDINYKISFPLPIPFSPRIYKILENIELDIIHSQHHTLLGSEAANWAKKKKIPLVFTWHTLFEQYVHFVPLVPKEWAAGWIIKKAVQYANRADYVIAPTDSVVKIIKNLGVDNKNIAPIPSGIDEKNFTDHNRYLIRKKYGVEEDEALLFSVCRLTEEKNVKFLFEAVIRVLKEKNNSKFMVVSGGNLESYLKKIVEEKGLSQRVIFAGIVGRDQIKNYFAAGDIFVYASKSETQGMIVSEAMYMGLPVVAVDATGSKDLIENNRTGFLVPEDEAVFAKSVVRLIEDGALRKKLSENSAGVAREKYTDKVCARKMLEVYEEAIRRKNA